MDKALQQISHELECGDLAFTLELTLITELLTPSSIRYGLVVGKISAGTSALANIAIIISHLTTT